MQVEDNLWKLRLGRLGFDNKRPWYEEHYAPVPLIQSKSIMSDTLPDSVPPLIKGGVLVTSSALYASDSSIAAEKAVDGGTGVLKRHVRVALYPVDTYKNSNDIVYVFTDSDTQAPQLLDRACKQYGHVVEGIDGNGDIVIVDEEYFLLDGRVVFKSPQYTNYLITFYEYTGKVGLSVLGSETIAASLQPVPPDARASYALDIPKTSDDLLEGALNKFLTEATLSNMLSSFSTDDLPEGHEAKYFDLSRVVSVSKVHIEERLSVLKTSDVIEDESLYFTEERVQDAASRFALSLFREDDSSFHFNLENLKATLRECDSSVLSEGPSGPHYFTETRVLSVCKSLVTGDITETSNKYFTVERAIDAVEPRIRELIQVVQDELTLDSINKGSDPFVYVKQLEDAMVSVSNNLNIPIVTSNVHESPGGPLYFTRERTLDCVSSDFQRLYDASLSISSIVHNLNTAKIEEHSSKRFFSAELLREYAHLISTDDISVGSRIFFDKTENDTTIERIARSITDESVSSLRSETASRFEGLTSNFIQEGSNKFFTDERVVSVIENLVSVPRCIEDKFVSQLEHASIWNEIFAGKTTDDLLEGSVHKFFDDALVQEIIRRTSVDTLLQGVSTYSDSKVRTVIRDCTLDDISDGQQRALFKVSDLEAWFDVQTTDRLKEGSTSFYWSAERASQLASDLALSISMYIPKSTDDIEEGAHLYFTEARTDARVEMALHNYIARPEMNSVSSALTTFIEEVDSKFSGAVERLNYDLSELHTGIVSETSNLYFTYARCVSCASTLTLDDIADGVQRGLMTESRVASIVQEGLLKEDFRVNTRLLDDTDQLLMVPEQVLSLSRECVDPLLNDMNGSIFSIQSRLSNLQFSSNTLSDDRLKFNELPIADALSVVMSISPKAYDMVTSLGATPDSAESFRDVGFIAQDILSVSQLTHAVVVGDSSTPFSLDYHSITTFAVGAIQELATRSLDTITEGLTNRHFTQENFDEFSQPILDRISGLTTSDIIEGDNIYLTDERVVSSLHQFGGLAFPDIEQFRYLISHITTDEISEGQLNKYNVNIPITTIDVPEEGDNLYFNSERCVSVCSNLITEQVSQLTTSDIYESENRRFLTLGSLTDHLRFVTADNIPNGLTHKYLTLDTFLLLNISTKHIKEDDDALYFKDGRCQAAVAGMSSDNWVEGNLNKYATPTNVRAALVASTTDDLKEGMINKYITRESFLDLSISTGDILGTDALATVIALSNLASTLRIETQDAAQSLAVDVTRFDLTLNAQILSVASTLSLNIYNVERDVLSISSSHSSDLTVLNANLTSELSVANAYVLSELSVSSEVLLSTLSVSSEGLLSTLSVSSEELFSALSASSKDLLSAISVSHNEQSVSLSLQSSTLVQVQSSLQTVTLSLHQTSMDSLVVTEHTLRAELSSSHTHLTQHNLSLQTQISAQEVVLQDTISLHSSFLATQISVSATNVTQSANEHSDEQVNLLKAEINNKVDGLTTDNVSETELNRYVSIDAIKSTRLSTDDIIETHNNLFFTISRVLDTLTTASTDMLNEGVNNLYVSKSNILSLNLHLNEFDGYSDILLSTAGAGLFTDENFMEKANRLLTTDDISQGSNNLYTTSETVSSVMPTLTTDDVQEGDARYVSESSVADVLTVSSIQNTGISPHDISARSIHDIITTSELEEADNLFFTSDRVVDVVSSLSTDDINEGDSNKYFSDSLVIDVVSKQLDTSSLSEGDNLYFTSERVVSALSIATSDLITEGQLNKYVTKQNIVDTIFSISPDPPDLQLTIQDSSVIFLVTLYAITCARVKVVIYDAGVILQEQDKFSSNQTTFAFHLLPAGRSLSVVCQIHTPYGTNSSTANLVIPSVPLSIDDVEIVANDGYASSINIRTTGDGNCKLLLKKGDVVLYNKDFYSYGSVQHNIILNFAFSEITAELMNDQDLIRTNIQNEFPARIDLFQTMTIETDASPSASKYSLFDGLEILLETDLGFLDGNKYGGRFNTDGGLIRAHQGELEFGVDSGTMKISLLGNTTFFKCVPS